MVRYIELRIKINGHEGTINRMLSNSYFIDITTAKVIEVKQ